VLVEKNVQEEIRQSNTSGVGWSGRVGLEEEARRMLKWRGDGACGVGVTR
jgi:hypothetical protein